MANNGKGMTNISLGANALNMESATLMFKERLKNLAL